MSTLLIIDDNQSVRESLRFLLRRRGYEVLVAASGAEALALAAQHPVDGAMIDINMPGMNGLEVCRQLRELAARTGRSIAMWTMTGARTSELARRSLEQGAIELLGKPFDFRALFAQFETRFGPQPAPERDDLFPVQVAPPPAGTSDSAQPFPAPSGAPPAAHPES